jgi:excisionase family DNA binding protein
MAKAKPRWPAEARASFSVGEIALRNGVSESYVYKQINDGLLKAVRISNGRGPLRIHVDDERAWLRGENPDSYIEPDELVVSGGAR